MIYGFIIAAGNQTRFNSSVPKALSKVGDVSCLDININNLGYLCDTVFVVCSEENEEYFKNYDRIIVSSGLGCGDAVFQALKHFNVKYNDTCFIQWGDCISEFELYKKTKKCYDFYKNHFDVIVPCEFCKDPYVRIFTADEDSRVGVEFSKFGEVRSSGFHDLSVFYGNMQAIKFGCDAFYGKYFDSKMNKYEHKHGNEFNFLDMLNEGYATSTIYFTENKYKSYAFNTIEEYDNIKEEIGGKEWI